MFLLPMAYSMVRQVFTVDFDQLLFDDQICSVQTIYNAHDEKIMNVLYELLKDEVRENALPIQFIK